MADALYALEKLADAADALETGAGSVHERLFEALCGSVPRTSRTTSCAAPSPS